MACEYGNRRIVRLHTNGTRTALASTAGSTAPRGAVVTPDGDLWFTTAPLSRVEEGGATDHGLWNLKRVRGAASEPVLALEGLRWPTGIAIAPDFDRLYVAHEAGWRVVSLTDGGMPVRDSWELAESDVTGGVVVDQEGFVYVSAGRDGVRVFDGKGEEVGGATFGANVVDVSLGGGFLYAAGHDRVWRVAVRHGHLKVPDLVAGSAWRG